MFPHLRDRLPEAPIQVLTAQHHQIDPILKEIKVLLNKTKPAQPIHTMDRLEDALYRIKMLWSDHIEVEEAAFGPEAIEPFLTMEERRRAGRITANHSARHQFPLSLLLPFLLYNMPQEDRDVMIQLMPPFIPPMLAVWKPGWKIMAPFLLPDA